MSIFLKRNDIKIKNPTTGEYEGQSLFTDGSTTEQIQEITQAGATQVAAINTKGEETLESIPADYTELSDSVSDLKSDLSDYNLNIYNFQSCTKALIASDGTITPRDDYITSDYIRLYADNVIVRTFEHASGTVPLRIAEYGSNKEFLERIYLTFNDGVANYKLRNSGCEYIRVCTASKKNSSEGYSDKIVVAYENQTEYVPFEIPNDRYARNTEEIGRKSFLNVGYVDDFCRGNILALSVHPLNGDTDCKVTCYGKNLLVMNPANTTVSGVTIAVNNDKSITLNGRATEDIIGIQSEKVLLKTGIYYINGCSGGSAQTYRLNLYNAENVVIAVSYTHATTLKIEEDTEVYAILYIGNGTELNNITCYPMLSVVGGNYIPHRTPLSFLANSGSMLDYKSAFIDGELTIIAEKDAIINIVYRKNTDKEYSRRGNRIVVDDMARNNAVKIAETYVNNKNEFLYGHNTAFCKTLERYDGKWRMNCSSFVMLITLGIPYNRSWYNGIENSCTRMGYVNQELLRWFSSHKTNTANIYSSSELARWCEEHGFTFAPSNIPSNLDVGDILFFNYNYLDDHDIEASYNGRYLGIDHSAIVAAISPNGAVILAHCIGAGSNSPGGPRFEMVSAQYLNAWVILAARFPKCGGTSREVIVIADTETNQEKTYAVTPTAEKIYTVYVKTEEETSVTVLSNTGSTLGSCETFCNYTLIPIVLNPEVESITVQLNSGTFTDFKLYEGIVTF